MFRPLLLAVAFAFAALAGAPAAAATIGGNPGPAHNYVCPHADRGPALDCYFDAVQHLYTMCRDVKAIEILEFGYDKSTEGTNGAKTEYCLDKQKENIKHPYLAALKQASLSQEAVTAIKNLQQVWLSALSNLQWRKGESDAQYKLRVSEPYEEFKDRITLIRTAYTEEEAHRSTVATMQRGKPAPAARIKPMTLGEAKQH
ncbi:MAG TPA: hypothetical protein VLU54_00975 [Casimicrobiaceae bacterium]|nr:hypothetical protein [Casimicrobiaceae bacterium]